MQCTCAILTSVACQAVSYFSTLSHKRHDFRKKKVTGQKKCVLILFTIFSQTFLILSRTERYIIKNAYWFSRKVPGHAVSHQMDTE